MIESSQPMNFSTDDFPEKLRQIDLTLLIPAYNEKDSMANILASPGALR